MSLTSVAFDWRSPAVSSPATDSAQLCLGRLQGFCSRSYTALESEQSTIGSLTSMFMHKSMFSNVLSVNLSIHCHCIVSPVSWLPMDALTVNFACLRDHIVL